MAFVGEAALALFRSAVAIIRTAGTALTERLLTQRLVRLYGETLGQSYQAYQAIARQARRSTRTGSEMQSSPATAYGSTNLPVDPSLGPGNERYNYRILVIVTDPNTGHEVRYVVDARSDVPRSLNDLTAVAQQQFQSWAPTPESRRGVAQIGQNAHIDVQVLSAGRRG